MANCGERYLMPKSKAIARLMRERGLTREKMAEKAPVSINTLRSVLEGRRAVMATLKKIAKALEVSPNEIIEDNTEDDAPPKDDRKGRRKADVRLVTPFDSFDETELPELIERIGKSIGSKYKIYIIAVGPGSVVITLDLEASDAERLIAALRAGKLKSLGVKSVYVYPLESEQTAASDLPMPRRKSQPEKKGWGRTTAAQSRLVRFAIAACLLVIMGIYIKNLRWIVGKRSEQPLPGLLAQGLQTRVDRLHIASGPFAGGFRLQENDGRLNWYFCNLGLLPLCKTRPAAVVAYLDLYLKNVDLATGTIADVKDIANGDRQPPDSDDSYAATFLTLASRYYQATNDRAWWQENRSRLKEIARKVLLGAQKPSGLVMNFANAPDRAAGFLMDNSEVYRGLADFSEQLARDNDADAGTFADAAGKVAQGIAGLYDKEKGAFRVADIPAATTFYPLRTAQVFPEVFGVPLGDAAQTRRMYDAAWNFMNASDERWEIGEVKDGSLGGYPWMVLGYAAAKRGDTARAKAQYAYFSEELKKPSPRPQFTAVNELGWAAMTRELIATEKK